MIDSAAWTDEDGPPNDDWIAAAYESAAERSRDDYCYGNEMLCHDTGISMVGR